MVTVAGAQRMVSGTVVSEDDGVSLPGVNVLIKGTTRGTTTNVEGYFTMQVSGPEDVLVFSFIGYEPKEVTVGQQAVINVSMQLSNQQLEEVVVMGYSQKKKQEITGAVANVSAEELKGVTGSSAEYMLQGKVAGVQVSTATGQPGTAAEIRIRGNSSVNADSGPLIVVDGIIGGTYNPNDIDNITVLKDAAAVALYGSRANAGVVVITTKRGTTEKPIFSYKGTIGVRKMTTGNFQLMNAQELYSTERQMFSSSATFNELRPASVLDNDTDWLDLAYKDGVIQNHTLSVRGKSHKTAYYLAADYYKEEGTLLTTGYERFNFRSNIDFELSKKLKLTTNIAITRDNTDSYHWRWPYQPFLYLPYDTPYDEDGSLRYVDASTSDFLSREKNNVLHSALYNEYNTKGFTTNGDLILTYQIKPWITLQSRNRFSYAAYRSLSYEDARTYEGASYDGVLTYSDSNAIGIISTNLVRLSKDFGYHHLSGFVGFEGQTSTGEDAGATGYGIVSGVKVPSAISTPQETTGSKTQQRAMSFLSEVSYDYQEKYFASLSFRRDASSKFGANKRWGNFGALSASWLISREDFFASLTDAVNMLKVRGSYGIVGQDNLPLFQYLATYNFTYQYNSESGGYPTTLSNPDLGWEQTKATDAGIDATLFNRIDVTVDMFYKNTDNLLLKVQLPPSQGIEEVWRNAGRIVNQGIEFSAGGDIIRTNALSWNLSFNIGTAQNRVKKLADGMDQVTRSYDGTKQAIAPGRDMNSWYLPKWKGVNTEDGSPQWEKAITDDDGNVTGYEITGDYEDASDASSLQYVGTATPKFYGGINTAVSYKQITLSISSAYQYGNKVYHSTREYIDADGANFNFNMMKLAKGWSRWEQAGDKATHPKLEYGGNNLSNSPSSRYLEDGSYLRIRNITLSYELPRKLLDAAKLTQARIYLSGDNLFTFTKFSGMDPEVSGYTAMGDDGTISSLAGISYFKYPISKQYLIGVQVSF